MRRATSGYENGRFLRYHNHFDNDIAYTTENKFNPQTGLPEYSVDIRGRKVNYEYDGFGRKLRSIQDDGLISGSYLRWVTENDSVAPQFAVYYSWSAVSGNAPVKVYYSNTHLELRTVTIGFDEQRIYIDTYYDGKGNIERKSDPYFSTEQPVFNHYTYDALNRPEVVKLSDNTETKYKYNGLTVEVTNAKNQTTSKKVNPIGWTVESVDANGEKVIFTHRSDGLVLNQEVEGFPGSKREYWYDLVGNLIRYRDQSQGTLGYKYDALGQLRADTNARNQVTTYDYDHLGRMTEKIKPEGVITWTYHEHGRDKGLIESVINSNGSHSIQYGQVLVRPNRTIVSEFSYDAWGRRRDPVTWVVFNTGVSFSTDKGFTGHEHIDLFQLVNMNGRIYDPFIGRFISPDPVLQFPDYTQGLNPYAYCLNNPLSLTDPDGYSVQGQFIALTFSTIITLASGGTLWWLSPIVYQTVMTIDYAIENRHADYNINLGRYFFTGIAISYVQAVATMGIGKIIGETSKEFGKEFIRSLLHGGVNGAIRKAQGGRFEHGFFSGFVSSLGGSYIQSSGMTNNRGAQIALSAAIGGTAEALGGGKFANGAVTGAYVMMLNHLDGELC
jgi:RHS repeat-associated protein